MQVRRKFRAYFLIEPPPLFRGRRRSRCDAGGRGRARERALESRRESLEARLHGDAARGDRLLVKLPRKRQYAASRQRAEQHRADDAARLGADRIHVAGHDPARLALERREHRLRVGDAVAQGGFFGDAVHPMRRGDDGGAIRTHQAAHRRSARLHELRGHDHIDIAGDGHERKYGRRAYFRPRAHLEVVHRRAGALRHARHGGRLHQPAVTLRDLDDPVGQHSAALAAESRDGDGDSRALRTHDGPGGVPPVVAERRSPCRAGRRAIGPSAWD